jgi:hypothetical protein
MMLGDNHDDRVPVTVFVTNASGSEMASKLTGYFVIRYQKFPFKAIAFGRIGGPNISLNIAKKNLDKIKKMSIDSDNLEILIRRKLIEGDVVLPEDSKRPNKPGRQL